MYPRLLFDSSMEKAMEQPVVLSEDEALTWPQAFQRHGVKTACCSDGASESVEGVCGIFARACDSEAVVGWTRLVEGSAGMTALTSLISLDGPSGGCWTIPGSAECHVELVSVVQSSAVASSGVRS